jgi:hypothetical protein
MTGGGCEYCTCTDCFPAFLYCCYSHNKIHRSRLRRREERGGETRLSLSLALFVFLLQGELPYGFRASFSSGLHGFQTNISLWRIWWGFGCPFHHQWVVQLLLCYTVICCGGGDDVGGNWAQKYLFLDCAWLSVLILEIEQTSGFARVARLLKICPFISLIPFSSNWGTHADENSLQAMEDPRHRRQVIWHLTDWIQFNSNASAY